MQVDGKILVLSGPSGSGVSTIIKKITEEDTNFMKAVSVTTRPPEKGEEDGDHYLFKTEEEFKKMIKKGEFLECANIKGHFYGVTITYVERLVDEGRVVIFNIDWQGAKIIKKRAKVEVKSIFIMPPTMAELQNRIAERGQDNPEEIEKLMKRAEVDISHKDEYDAVILNGDLNLAAREVINIAKS